MRIIGIIDYSIGNIYSVQKAFEHVGGHVRLVTTPKEILEVDHLVLPGVGAFSKCYQALQNKELVDPILQFIQSGNPFMGICVGMQLLFSKSTEDRISKGLGILKGEVDLIQKNREDIKLPHIGWKSLKIENCRSNIFKHINSLDEFYFVHSYHATVMDNAIHCIKTEYEDIPITAYIEKDNIHGCQFHPEKSRNSGLKLLENFLNM